MEPEKTYQETCHEEVLRNAPSREQHLFELVTDGSGWDKDKAAIGSAWILQACPHVQDPELQKLKWRGCSGATAGTVQRAELLALIGGLHALASAFDMLSLAGLRSYLGKPLASVEAFPEANRPLVWWVSDRETIVLQMARRSDGTTYYERNKDMDLWCQLYWYERIFRVTPVYLSRNTTDAQKAVDEQAGNMREIFKEIVAGDKKP